MGKRVVSKYISDDEVVSVKKGLSRRLELGEELLAINTRISELEAAARLIDANVYNKLLLLKTCMPMELISEKLPLATTMGAVIPVRMLRP